MAVGAGWFEALRHRLMDAEPSRSSYANNVHPRIAGYIGRLAAMAKERGDLDWTAAALNVSDDAGLS